MSLIAEIDDECQNCAGTLTEFNTKIIKGHSKRHRIGKCKDCKKEDVLGMCEGC